MILGVDAGGTTCRLALEHDGQRTEVTLGAANVTSDFDAAVTVLRAGLAQLAQEAGLSLDALRPCPAWLAVAGVTGPEMADRLRAALPLERATVDEDRRAALAGALGDRTGCLAGIGTGSFLARQDGATFVTLGGHGLVLGDEGSGAWLGRELLSYCLRAHDGLEPMTPLAETVLRDFGGVVGIVALAARATPQDFARLAPRITESQDAAAAMQMRRGAAWLATGLNALGWSPGEPICLMGGVAPAYARWLPREMAENRVPPSGTALDGALLLARRAG
ncbi:ATPase [Salipiger aestuarii]|uniref:Glucosamine kinase n=1 Tax=Salipiger aestuarii TaxID=568098 RepID=A0A327YRL9_9RHOB|nr:BadF/BadG/BcrA/BcrD ATPase family protein [Salipiger aestuarii]EIE49097.1 BadF/BadG/BcrA/BcrD ATPase family protein [Citreicella sp. 357]KAA8609636.1 ATPase [Salipiger aestuarii]KAA8612955.1 ATPase [Salipiger aestuarii]KAB2543735.1 ATPase [Salipiger aestuarii]RAK22986.1 glucosamine kinase [Salipiger aestuarii]